MDARRTGPRSGGGVNGRLPFSPICWPPNNLGLAYAVGGSLEDSERAFASGGEQARAHYNMGIVSARRQHADALKAFEAAQRARPEFAAAAARARQAWQLANRSN